MTPIESQRDISRTIVSDLTVGLWNSRIFKAVIITAASITAIALATQPAAWILVAAAIAILAVALWMTHPESPKRAIQEITFELSSIGRLSNDRNFDRIDENVFLGSIPNRLTSDWQKMQESGIGAVLSINEPWERKPMGLSLPYTPNDWQQLGIAYQAINQKDHTLSSLENLHKQADWIHEQVQQNRKVLVHCRAGKSRSAIAVAAYLIKYKNMTPLSACDWIKSARPVSRLDKTERVEWLAQFHQSCSCL